MNSRTTKSFRSAFRELPSRVQQSAKRAYKQFRIDPSHPSLQFKKVHQTEPIYSARIGLGYRALGVLERSEIIWFWIGIHAEYERLLTRMRGN